MRALLVCNPKATTSSDRVRDVLVRALRSETDLEVAYTRRRGHGAQFGRSARKDGVELVVALGGDGTVNEVINGLLADGTGPDVPTLAVVSGGSTNVFARALGLPNDWAEGTGVILEAIREGRSRAVGLGKASLAAGGTSTIGGHDVTGGDDPLSGRDRYFTFCAGLGMDAEVIRRVERARRRGRKSTPLLYLQAMTSNYLFDKASRSQRITLDRPGAPSHPGLATVIVQNTAPWTYIGDRRIDANPEASFDLGLDLMAMTSMNAFSAGRTMTQLTVGRRDQETGMAIGPHGKHVLRLHDLPEFTLSAKLPVGLQVDGDYIGERDKVVFSAVPAAIRVLC